MLCKLVCMTHLLLKVYLEAPMVNLPRVSRGWAYPVCVDALQVEGESLAAGHLQVVREEARACSLQF